MSKSRPSRGKSTAGTGAPEPPTDLEPLTTTWPGGTELSRIHRLAHGPAEFNPGLGPARGRFHPFPGPSGAPVPTLYAAETWEAAVCEAVFRDVPVRGPDRRKALAELEVRGLSRLRLRREVTLVDLRAIGLRRLELHRRELIDTEADEYLRTTRWAQALHAAVPDAAGLVWIARLADSPAVVFFGDRLAEADFEVVDGPLCLGETKGLALVMELADKAKIVIT